MKRDKVRLEDVIIYVLARYSQEENSFRIYKGDVDHVVFEVKDEIKDLFDINTKFHESEHDMYSRQVRRAMNEVAGLKVITEGSYYVFNSELAEKQLDKIDETFNNSNIDSLKELYSEDLKQTIENNVD